VLPQMRHQGSGRILAVASRQAVEPAAMVGAYSASKAALVSLIHTIALENKDRCISANTVLPGTMDTPGQSRRRRQSRWLAVGAAVAGRCAPGSSRVRSRRADHGNGHPDLREAGVACRSRSSSSPPSRCMG
jgi:NAD(P)-dependent dehydrogenase (short-subunit alcohol dehydrogenase family)